MTDATSPLSSGEAEGPMLLAGDDPGSADAYLLLLPDDDSPAQHGPAPFEDSTLRPEELPEPAKRLSDEPSESA